MISRIALLLIIFASIFVPRLLAGVSAMAAPDGCGGCAETVDADNLTAESEFKVLFATGGLQTVCTLKLTLVMQEPGNLCAGDGGCSQKTCFVRWHVQVDATPGPGATAHTNCEDALFVLRENGNKLLPTTFSGDDFEGGPHVITNPDYNDQGEDGTFATSTSCGSGGFQTITIDVVDPDGSGSSYVVDDTDKDAYVGIDCDECIQPE